ncbi:MAG: tRNA 2-thiouridine(34) synthase MnmA [Bacillota bacterium]|jgi:tRNA-specific 2-thiouridylase
MSKGKVLVAMSGGVDSSVAAVLLREQGYEVVGATMRLWSPAGEEYYDHPGSCCSLSSVEDARRVAASLDMPFYVLNFREAFADKVVAYFIESYRAGNTPNPCIACNRYMKFDLFLQKALALGLDYMATGHYVRRVVEGDRYYLEKAKDEQKDQSYALYNITNEQLWRILFPLGDLTKSEVRAIARQYGLPTAEKEESQEICFIPDDDYKRFLEQEAGMQARPGKIVLTDGRVVGEHNGVQNYTVGQRRGLGVTWPEPLYVLAVQPETNQVVVGTADQVWSDQLIADDCNLLYWPWSEDTVELTAKIRYHAAAVPCLAQLLPPRQLRVRFLQPVRAITPGQAVVLYADRRVVGGGIIQRQP